MYREVRAKVIKNEGKRPSPMQESGAPCMVEKWRENLITILWWLHYLEINPSVFPKLSLKSARLSAWGSLPNPPYHQTRTSSEFHDWVDLVRGGGAGKTAGVRE